MDKSKKQTEKPQKRKYIVRVEGIVPIVVEYEIVAIDEKEAEQAIERHSFLAKMRDRPIMDLRKIRKQSISVKDVLTGQIGLRKKF